MGTAPADVTVDVTLVRRLLAQQHPNIAHLSLEPLDGGWDNAIFRLGEALCVRMPKRSEAGPLMENELRWLPELAPRLPLPVPVARYVGRPGQGYPFAWSVVPWIEGHTASQPLRTDQAGALCEFLHALHRPAPPDAPHNQVRGVALGSRDGVVTERMARVAARWPAMPDRIEAIWQAALGAPMPDRRRWIHGDLHPRNVVVREGRLCGILDWGDMAAGDVSTDVASVWMLMADPVQRRGALRRYLAPSDLVDRSLVLRAAGWAVMFGTTLMDSGLKDEHATHTAIGRDILERLATDANWILDR